MPSAQSDVGLLSSQRDPKLSTLTQGAFQPLQPAQVTLINTSSSQGDTGHFQCVQDALEHFAT